MKAIMYHYVRRESQEFPLLKSLHVDDFIKQLDYFEEKYGIANYNDFVELARGIVKEKVYLTFDDGLSDHYDYVYPELKRRNVSGIFYIPTGPYIDQTILDVHKVHLILAKGAVQKVYDNLLALITDDMIEHKDEFESETYVYQSNDAMTLRIKRMLNYFLSYKWRKTVIAELFTTFVGNEHDYFERVYMSKEQVTELSMNNMIVGSHSISHPVFSRLPYEQQAKEIKGSFSFLSAISDIERIKTFCFPYGGKATYNTDTINILQDEGCDFCFSVEPDDINTNTYKERSLDLPRYDCNQFPHGRCRC